MTYFGDKQPTPRVLSVLKKTNREAAMRRHSYIGTEHLLLGLLAEPDGIAGRVLTELGVAEDAADRLREIMDSASYNPPSSVERDCEP